MKSANIIIRSVAKVGIVALVDEVTGYQYEREKDELQKILKAYILFIENNAGSKNPYDIQEFLIQQAVVCPEKFLQPEEIDKIKIDAYNTGVNIVPYMRVIAVLARDKYFSEHNILVEDVDKHDPLNKNKKPE